MNTIYARIVSLVGLLILLALAWVLSEDRKHVPWRVIVWGVGLQFVFGLLLLPTFVQRMVLAPVLRGGVWLMTLGRVQVEAQPDELFFRGMQWIVDLLTESTAAGAEFVFGSLVTDQAIGAQVAFQVLPVIIFVSALAAILFHLGIIQLLVRFMAWLMRKSMGTSGAETFGSALLIVLGIESVTAIREYLRTMTRSELCTVLTTFMATIAGSVMVVYAGFGVEPGHLLTASLMSAPAAIVVSKLMVPEQETPQTTDREAISIPVDTHNVVDAAAVGASDGLKLALNVGAMLIAFIGIVYLINAGLALVSQPLLDGIYAPWAEARGWTIPEAITLKGLVGVVFIPFAFILGTPLGDVVTVGQLLGTKTVLNEFLAFIDLQQLGDTLSPRGFTIATYALCGFANPGSLGIAIAGVSGLLPDRRPLIVALAVKSFIGGTLACFSTACVAGILIYA